MRNPALYLELQLRVAFLRQRREDPFDRWKHARVLRKLVYLSRNGDLSAIPDDLIDDAAFRRVGFNNLGRSTIASDGVRSRRRGVYLPHHAAQPLVQSKSPAVPTTPPRPMIPIHSKISFAFLIESRLIKTVS